MSNQPFKIRKSVIREDLYALTLNSLSARILAQFIYWMERTSDYDKFIQEENERAIANGQDPQQDPTHGWIYKKASELAAEIMADEGEVTIRRRIQELVDMGWLEERNNPKYKWDRTLQYRVNLALIISDLSIIGFSLDGYNILNTSKLQNEVWKEEFEGAIPEITTETTKERKKTTVISEKPKAQRAPDPLFDAIKEVFGLLDRDRIGTVRTVMLGKSTNPRYASCNFDTPATGEEVLKFAKWYKSKYPKLSMPQDISKIHRHFHDFRKSGGNTIESRVLNGRYQEKLGGVWTDVWGAHNAQYD